MRVVPLGIEDVLLIETQRFHDERGNFREAWRETRYSEAGIPARFVQDNVSVSKRGVLRGLHLQHPTGQGKLVSVLAGEILDVAVDVRRGSPTFGQWVGAMLSAENARQLYIPVGFAHGFAVTSDEALVLYKCTDYHASEDEVTVLWDDPDIGIEWPESSPILSRKDAEGIWLKDIEPGRLPQYSGSELLVPESPLSRSQPG